MLNLSLLLWLLLIAAVAAFWWRSDRIKQEAMLIVSQHCRSQGLQLLDQSLVLKGLWPVREAGAGWRLRRRYQFEFSSTGEQRYRGNLVLVGRDPARIDLEPHVLPDSEKQRWH